MGWLVKNLYFAKVVCAEQVLVITDSIKLNHDTLKHTIITLSLHYRYTMFTYLQAIDKQAKHTIITLSLHYRYTIFTYLQAINKQARLTLTPKVSTPTDSETLTSTARPPRVPWSWRERGNKWIVRCTPSSSLYLVSCSSSGWWFKSVTVSVTQTVFTFTRQSQTALRLK